ncbi:MAG: hypothetical protein WAK82_36810 [Streptosporangiaceae bacterium]
MRLRRGGASEPHELDRKHVKQGALERRDLPGEVIGHRVPADRLKEPLELAAVRDDCAGFVQLPWNLLTSGVDQPLRLRPP